MTDPKLIPPPELVEPSSSQLCQILDGLDHCFSKGSKMDYLRQWIWDWTNRAAQWGADQEILACGNYLKQCAAWEEEDVIEFYNYRRPKPPSLKALALEELEELKGDANSMGMGFEAPAILRALEALPDD